MLKIFNRATKTEAEIKQLTRMSNKITLMSNKITLLTHENETLKTKNAQLTETVIGVTQQLKEAITS